MPRVEELLDMNSVSLVNLHNCTAVVLDQNITLLMGLNRSELLQVLKEALDRSLQREILRDALTDCLHTNQQRPFDLPWWQKLVWSLVYAIILMVATGGNIIVMWIVLGMFISLFQSHCHSHCVNNN